jgi:hypothetical protein
MRNLKRDRPLAEESTEMKKPKWVEDTGKGSSRS